MFKTDKGTILLTEQEFRTLADTIVDVHQFLVKAKRMLSREDCPTFGANQQLAMCNNVMRQFKMQPKTDEIFTVVDPLYLK